jgi:hypothetical protein
MFMADTVEVVYATVTLRAAGATTQTNITSTSQLQCRTVTATGGGIANVKFGETASCQFGQVDSGSPATMRTRTDDGTLLWVDNASLACTVGNTAAEIKLCGAGTLTSSGKVTQVTVDCRTPADMTVPGPVTIQVVTGSARFEVPTSNPSTVTAGEHLDYPPPNKLSCRACAPAIIRPPTTLPQGVANTFAAQARSLGLATGALQTTTTKG